MSIWNLSDEKYHKLVNVVDNIFAIGGIILVATSYTIWVANCLSNIKYLWFLPIYITPLIALIISLWLSNERTDYYKEDEGVDKFKQIKNENERLKRQIKYLKKTKNLIVL